MRPSLRTAVVAAALAIAALLPAGTGHTAVELDESIRSPALGGPVHALVVLPEGYGKSDRRYPVVYFLHGLPAGPDAYRSSGWLADAVEAAGDAIVVLPQGARAGDTDPEYRDWGRGRDWETFVARDLTAFVDAHFRTVRARAGRAIVGLSAGGYGAAAIGLAHLDRFAVVESWSGYFHATDPTGTRSIAAGPRSNVHRLVPRIAAEKRRHPTFLGFYVGADDRRFRAENEALHRELRRAGVRHDFAVYPGGHESALWRAHARDWLARALAHLAAG